MEKLTRIFGVIISTFFTAEGNGVTLAEVSRVQAEAKQQNDGFWARIGEAASGIYHRVISYVGAGASAPQTLEAVKFEVEDFADYAGVADRGARVSSLMHAVKLFKRLESDLRMREMWEFVIDKLPNAPERPELPKSATVGETERFMDIANIDEMIAGLGPEVLAQFDFAFWQLAQQLNSRAAVLGKLLSEQGSFFREMVKAKPSDKEQLVGNGMLVTRWKPTYADEEVREFERLREKLRAEYEDLQKRLNGCKKQIKDAVRAYNLEQQVQYESALSAYRIEAEKYSLEVERIRKAAETFRQQAQAELATLRVRTE